MVTRMDAHWYRQLGARISRLRARAALTQEALAERAGIGASYVARIESGVRRPTLDVLGALADALNIPLVRLLADERTSRGADTVETWTKATRTLVGIVPDLDDHDADFLVRLATRLHRS